MSLFFLYVPLRLIVRFLDADSGILMLRVSRDNYSKVRAAMTMLTSLSVSPIRSNSGSGKGQTAQQQQQPRLRAVASVLSVHGSMRTAKLGIIQQIKHHYRHKLKAVGNDERELDRTTRSLEECVAKMQNLD